MHQRRFVGFLWMAKAFLLVVLIYMGFEVATNRLHLARLDPQAARGEPPCGVEPITLAQNRASPDYSAIVQQDLFRESDHNDVAPGGDRAPTTEPPAGPEDLGLSLVGTIAGGPTTSRAVLQNARTHTTDSYRIGDTVAAAVVEAIERETVVLRYQGRSLVLKQSAGKTDNRAPHAAPDRPPSAAGEPAGTGRSQLATAAAAVDSSRSGYVAEVFRLATIEPYVKNNRTEGLKISGLEKIPLAELFGLKNGDIVQAINGQQLTSKQKAFQVLMKARTQPRVDIQLVRDGQRKGLSFDL